MNSFKKRAKRAIYSWRGSFPYFGASIFFPPRSHLFERVVQEGVYERDSVTRLLAAVQPGSTFFDVGANIGLISVPVLQRVGEARVVSFEPSPNALPYLLRSQAAFPERGRWQVVGKALGAHPGTADFFTAGPANSAFDGLRDTKKQGARSRVGVEVTTLDDQWRELGRPTVSVVKIDVEGGELGVLEGGDQLLRECRPAIFLEWDARHLREYGVAPEALLTWCEQRAYRLFSLPTCAETVVRAQLTLQMLNGHDFVCLPCQSAGAASSGKASR